MNRTNMNTTPKTAFLFLFLCFLSTSIWAQQKKSKAKPLSFPMTEKHWATLTKDTEFITYKGVPAVQGARNAAMGVLLKDMVFTNGTIEYDVALKGQGFPGINYRISKDSLHYETFYLRYFGSADAKLRYTTQYAPIVDKVNLWDLTDDYQAAVELNETGWNHIKMVIHGKQMRVYVNHMETPSLWVPAMEGITDKGSIALNGNAIYANVVITPDAVDNVPALAGYDPTYNDPRYIREWQVTQPIPYPFGTDLLEGIPVSPGVQIAASYLGENANWKFIAAGRRALVNLTKEFGGTPNGERRLAWLKTIITANKEMDKVLRLGFSDEVWVFINGKPLYQDRNFYGAPGMKFPKGRTSIENAAFTIPLQEGENEVLIGLSNYFYGWGIIARIEDTNGIQFN